MLRLALFLGTNIAILVLLGFIVAVLGLERWLASQGVQGDLASLPVVCAVMGLAGSRIFLVMTHPLLDERTATLRAGR